MALVQVPHWLMNYLKTLKRATRSDLPSLTANPVTNSPPPADSRQRLVLAMSACVPLKFIVSMAAVASRVTVRMLSLVMFIFLSMTLTCFFNLGHILLEVGHTLLDFIAALSRLPNDRSRPYRSSQETESVMVKQLYHKRDLVSEHSS